MCLGTRIRYDKLRDLGCFEQFEEDCHQEDVTKAETSNKKNAATDQQWRIVTFRAPDRADK